MTVIPVSNIIPNPQQPRKNFSQVELQELADSIRINGLLQPILVEEGNPYILIAGERRLRAHQLLGLTEIEAIVKPPMNGTGVKERSILALLENLQRSNLSPVEEARAYDQLSRMGMSNAEISHRIGVSGATVANRLLMLQLEDEIQDLMDANLMPIDRRVIDALRSVPDEARVPFARKLARPGLSIKAVQTGAEKLNAAIRAERISQEPAPFFAARKAGERNIPNWDALHQLGKVPPWEMVARSANHTCSTCALRDEASAVVCGQCPAVVMLATMIEVSHEPVRK